MNKVSPLKYLIKRAGYRIKEFFRHWYVKTTRMYWNFIINKIEQLDYKLALKITAKHLFEPLYQDYSLIGYVLGFIFRFFRIILALLIYGAFLLIASILYLFWVLIPPIVIFNALRGYPI